MKLRFQHANPYHGRESLLLRFEGLLPDQVACVLVDAGAGVNVDELLDPDEGEHLAAICLTHAHLDHYQSLDENLQDGAPVYAAPDTARILGDVFEAGADHYDLGDVDAVLDRLEPVSEWTQVIAGLRVRPVPAGHAPGACGFLFDARDGDVRRTVLATGDFTARRAAGYRGLDLDLPVDVDVLALTGATNDAFEETLTDAVATVYERAHAGSTALVTASGLTGVHLAYLLGHVADERDRVPITLVGHAATLYDRLDYAVPNVTAVPEFATPDEVLRAGGVTIAGPEVPVDGSAGRLFGALEDDPTATLVQVTNGGSEPVATAGCTVHHFALSNHPTRATVDEVVDRLSPVHVVVTHQRGSAADRYKDSYDSFVWATDDEAVYTLLDESGWTPPPWVTAATERRIRARQRMNGSALRAGLTDAEIPLPSVARAEEVDLAAEGLDLSTLRERVPTGGPAGDAPGGEEAASPDEPAGGASPADATADATTGAADGGATAAPGAIGGDVVARLERIEAAVAGPRHRGRVVDAGDGVVLLRLDDPPEGFEHGERVEISFLHREDATGE